MMLLYSSSRYRQQSVMIVAFNKSILRFHDAAGFVTAQDSLISASVVLVLKKAFVC